MSYRLILESRAEKELDKIPKTYHGKIIKALRSLTEDPFQGKKLDGELKGMYSIRVWPYRIIYEIRKKELYVIIVHVGHRQGVYKE